jgi:hypothetical protein
MRRTICLVAFIAVLGLALAAVAGAKTSTTSTNNGGNNPSCGASCDQSHNPTDVTKSCDPVPGNGCHLLPDTPCERGHGGTEIGNKHCAGLSILKEQSLDTVSYSHDLLIAPVFDQINYRITVTNSTNTSYTLVASDPLCDPTLYFAGALDPSGPQTLPAGGTVVYTCFIDTLPGSGLQTPGAGGVPMNAQPGAGPYTLTNAVTVVATDGGGNSVTLTDSVTASLN